MSSLIDGNLEPENWLIEHNSEAKQLLKNPLLEKDVWRVIEDLGLEIKPHARILIIPFDSIEQDWLKLLIKLYILVRSQRNITSSYLRQEVFYLSRFSQFLHQQMILTPEPINDQIFSDFESYLQHLNLAPKTIISHLSSLKTFLNLCRQEKWLNINTYWFNNKIKSVKNQKIDYIPEEVYQQLEEHLYHLPEPIQRMVIIIRATGLRIGELLNLPLNCLRQRDKQWRLRFLTEKYQVEDEIPICPELVIIIQEQQQYIRLHFRNSYHNLFGSNNGGRYYKPVPKIMGIIAFNKWLNKLAKEHNICTKEGQIWHFQSHQFRRTVGTIMENAGVRALIIQKYLRHRSPDMQNYYKHLLKQVIGTEYQELMKETKYVDSTGKLVTSHKPQNPITEIIRRKMYQITTQYGECHRPVLKSPCQTVNACWSCEAWRTSTDDLDYLRQDLARLDSEIALAHQLGMIRQEKGLINDQQKLKIRIESLKQINHEN
jgi:integrase